MLITLILLLECYTATHTNCQLLMRTSLTVILCYVQKLCFVNCFLRIYDDDGDDDDDDDDDDSLTQGQCAVKPTVLSQPQGINDI